MRLVVQRVDRAAVDVGGERIAEIERGLLVLVGIGTEDVGVDFDRAARKIVELRIFEDGEGKMNCSLQEIEGAILAVSQFTLYADTKGGRRPSFVGAAPPELAKPLFDTLVTALRAQGVRVDTGRFGAKMNVELVNAGPVTLVMEVEPKGRSD